MNELDFQTRLKLQEKRDLLLDTLAGSNFTPEQYQDIYAELAELSLTLGPDESDMAEAHLYRDMRASLSYIQDLQSDTATLIGLADRESRRWHPKQEDSHG